MQNFIVATTILTLGLISPGPDFLLVSNTSMNKGRMAGVLLSFGMGFGIAFVVSSLLFFQSYLDSNFQSITPFLKLFGFLYLSFLSFKMIYNAFGDNKKHKLPDNEENLNKANLFGLGFLNSTTNPKAGLFLLSILTVEINNRTTLLVKLLYGLEIFFLTIFWFVCVSFFFSSNPLRQLYIKYSTEINLVFGVVIGVFAIKIFTTLF